MYNTKIIFENSEDVFVTPAYSHIFSFFGMKLEFN